MQYSKWGLTIVFYSGIISSFSLYTIFRLINQRIWFPFAAAIPHCSDTFMSALIVNLKSFSFKVVFSTVPPIVYCASSFPCPVWKHLHFPQLNSICHFSDHSINLLRSSCKCYLSASHLIFLNTFVSSADFNTLLVMSSSKSLIYIKNQIRPNTDPCGTPLNNDFQFETSPLSTTLCLLSISHFSIQLIIPFPMPRAFSLSSNLWCGTLSKAFLKPKYIISTGDHSSFVTSSKKHNMFAKHDLAFRNPCWDGLIKLFFYKKINQVIFNYSF